MLFGWTFSLEKFWVGSGPNRRKWLFVFHWQSNNKWKNVTTENKVNTAQYQKCWRTNAINLRTLFLQLNNLLAVQPWSLIGLYLTSTNGLLYKSSITVKQEQNQSIHTKDGSIWNTPNRHKSLLKQRQPNCWTKPKHYTNCGIPRLAKWHASSLPIWGRHTKCK